MKDTSVVLAGPWASSSKVTGVLGLLLLLLLLETLPGTVSAFSASLFQEVPAAQQIFPSKTVGTDIELPDFEELFGRIQQVSPLARVAIEGNKQEADGCAAPDRAAGGTRGFAAATDQSGMCVGWLAMTWLHPSHPY
jgi:hypothetical protein